MRRKTVEARVLHAGRPSCRLASGICTLQDAQNLKGNATLKNIWLKMKSYVY